MYDIDVSVRCGGLFQPSTYKTLQTISGQLAVARSIVNNPRDKESHNARAPKKVRGSNQFIFWHSRLRRSIKFCTFSFFPYVRKPTSEIVSLQQAIQFSALQGNRRGKRTCTVCSTEDETRI